MPRNLGWVTVANMTRETKLGLVVSCSFLCLLGMVLGLKLGEAPADTAVAAGKQEGEEGPPPASGEPDSAVEIGKKEREASDPNLLPASLKLAPQLSLVATSESSGTTDSGKSSTVGAVAMANPAGEGGAGGPSALPIPQPPEAKKEVALPPHLIPEKEKEAAKVMPLPPLAAAEKPAKAANPPPLPGVPTQEEKDGKNAEGRSVPPLPDKVAAKADEKEKEKAAEKSPVVPALALPLKQEPAKLAAVPPPPETPMPHEPKDESESTAPLPPFPPLQDRPGEKTAPMPHVGATPLLPAAGEGSKPSPPLVTPTPPIPPEKEPGPKPPVVTPIPSAARLAPPEETAPPPAPPPPPPTKVDARLTGLGSDVVPEIKLRSGAPPTLVGSTPPTATVPPIAVGGPSAVLLQPKVITFTEKVVAAYAGETFDRISQREYGSERYGQALMLFNRNHPLATDNAATDGGTLKTGQRVYLPPREVLESRYPSAINKGDATETQRSNAAPASRKYTVPVGGELMVKIAQRELGDLERWREINLMNPGWDPQRPVPAGTVLMLPERR